MTQRHIETEQPVTIVQVQPPRDVLALADHEHLGFAKRDMLRRFLVAHHVPVVVDGKELRFTRADFLAAVARGARVLPSRVRAAVRTVPVPKPAPLSPADEALERSGLRVVGGKR